MIDKIRFSKKNVSDNEIRKLVDKNNLETFDVNGIKHYNNTKTKNFNGGFHIQIDAKKTLIVEGSLHKYATFLSLKKLDNFDSFTMQKALQTYFKLIVNLAINPTNIFVNKFEIGLNVVIDIETSELLKNIYSIGDLDKEKKFYFNPKFKKETVKTTEFHKDFRLVYRIYDKIYEMIESKKDVPNQKIVRIETINQKVEKTLLINFFTATHLQRLQNIFFEKWDKLNFDIEILAPPKTGTAKIEYAKKLYKSNSNDILKEIAVQFANNTLSAKRYYTLKRFIDNWETEKKNFVATKSIVLLSWTKLYVTEKQVYSIKK